MISNVIAVQISVKLYNCSRVLGGGRIQDGKRGGQRCRELQQQRQGGNLRIGHASQLAASSHGIPTQISGLLKTRLNLLARERQWKIAICGKIALGIFSLYLTD